MTDVYGVFEGGGVRGSVLVGAVAAAEEKGFTFRAVAGTSAGAIVAALIAAGYGAAEMKKVLEDVDFKSFEDHCNLWCRLPGKVGQFAAWNTLGRFKGEAFMRWISELISLKVTGRRNESPTFAQLPKPLKIIATDITRQRILTFSREQSTDMVVADAVRMSMSIPVVFRPVTYANSLVVDGGALSNFPAWAFDAELEKAPLPVLGFRLERDDEPARQIKNLYDLLMALGFTMMSATLGLQNAHVAGLQEINLPTLGVKTTDFGISAQKKQELYQAGYELALRHFETPEESATPALPGNQEEV